MILDQVIRRNERLSDGTSISEKPFRSVAKSISWRIIGTLDTIIISWLITGQLTMAFSIGSVELFTKMVLYFFHERIWNTIKWGK